MPIDVPRIESFLNEALVWIVARIRKTSLGRLRSRVEEIGRRDPWIRGGFIIRLTLHARLGNLRQLIFGVRRARSLTTT